MYNSSAVPYNVRSLVKQKADFCRLPFTRIPHLDNRVLVTTIRTQIPLICPYELLQQFFRVKQVPEFLKLNLLSFFLTKIVF